MSRMTKMAAVLLSACVAGQANAATKNNNDVAEWNADVYAMMSSVDQRAESAYVFTPAVVNRSGDVYRSEVRARLLVELDDLRWMVRPIVAVQKNEQGYSNDVYVSRWQLRSKVFDNPYVSNLYVSYGREQLTWGNAQFRSPSNPFYFNSWRDNPIHELGGVTHFKVEWMPNQTSSLMLAKVIATSRLAPTAGDDGIWFKANTQIANWSATANLFKAPEQQVFLGASGQYAPATNVNLYGEFASASRSNYLQSSANVQTPFNLQRDSDRQATMLVGASFTFPNTDKVSVEYLHDGHGYHKNELESYYRRAASASQISDMALFNRQSLLGRDYLHVALDSRSPNKLLRASFSQSITDKGSQLSIYAEERFFDMLNVFGLGVLPLGDTHKEFSNLTRYSIMTGVKMSF